MAAICLDFKWLGFWISDPIQNQDHLQPNLFLTIPKSRQVQIPDSHCTIIKLSTKQARAFTLRLLKISSEIARICH